MDETTLIEKAKKVFSRQGLSLFLVLVIGSVLQFVLAAVISRLYGEDWTDTALLYVATFVLLYVIAVPIGLYLLSKNEYEKPEDHPLGIARWLKFFVISIFAMYTGSLIGVLISVLLPTGQGGVENPLNSYISSGPLWLRIVFLVILAPLIEELIFRRVLIGQLRRYGERLAVIVSALMFGLFHGNFIQFFYAFFLGLIFGYVYLRTGRLRYTVALHMTVNFMGTIIVGSLLNGMDPDALKAVNEMDAAALAGGADPSLLSSVLTPAFIGFMIYLLIIVILWIVGLVLFCISFGKRQYFAAPEELPQGKRASTVLGNAGMILFLVGCVILFVVSAVS